MSTENNPSPKAPEQKGGHGGPPMVFAMPMFHAFVPKAVRPWIYVVLAFCFQFSGGVYLGSLASMMGEHSLMREDIQMCLYSTLAGMAFYFPVLFRMKFHFTNKFLLMTAALVVLLCNTVTMFDLPLPLLWVVCFVCGMGKLQGTFECMSNIQLWMTPKRDMAVFFPLLNIILLTAIEGGGFIAAYLGHHGHWTLMHWFAMGLMLIVLFVQALLTHPVHAMPKIVPLRGIDWKGALLWAITVMQATYILNYGDWLDWWNSPTVRLLTGTTILSFLVALRRMHTATEPYFDPAIWRYKYMVPIVLLIAVVEALLSTEHALETVFCSAILHYDNLTQQSLSVYSIAGIWCGCLFSLGWLRLMRWSAYRLIAIGIFSFVAYAVMLYFLIDTTIDVHQLYVPLFMRGFAYAVLSVSLMWALSVVMSFQHFFQALSVFNIFHMFIGGLVGSAFYAYGLRFYVADGFARYGSDLTAVALSRLPQHGADVLSTLSPTLTAQGLKTLYGWTIYAALFFALLMLLWDIPGVRRRVHRVPSWPSVGQQLLTGAKRRERLRKLRRERQQAAAIG